MQTYQKCSGVTKLFLLLIGLLSGQQVARADEQSFTINQNYFLFQSDLSSVYSGFTAPEFDQLSWCLIDSSSGFVFLFCDGLELSLMFDSESFLKASPNSIDSAEDIADSFSLLQEITAERVLPYQIQDLSSIGDSVSVISRNTTRQGQAQSILTFYRVPSGNEDQPIVVKARKVDFRDTNEVLSAWGSQSLQLYHTLIKSTNQEEIIVNYYSSSNPFGKVVTQLNLHDVPERTSETTLTYDIYQREAGEESYTIYVVGKHTAVTDGQVVQALYKHDISTQSNNKAEISSTVQLGENCVDQILVHDKLIALLCIDTKQIAFLDRERMELLPANIRIQDDEVFTRVDNFAESTVNSIDDENLIFKSDLMQVVGREGQLQVFFTTYNEAEDTYRLKMADIILNYQVTSALDLREIQSIYTSVDAYEILNSSRKPGLMKLGDSQISLFFEGQAQFAHTYPVCNLDQFLTQDLDGARCGQCTLGSYSLSPQALVCHSCAYLSGNILDNTAFNKLQYLCDNKIGQISAANRGVYELDEYPSQRVFAAEWREIMETLGIEDDTTEEEEGGDTNPFFDVENIDFTEDNTAEGGDDQTIDGATEEVTDETKEDTMDEEEAEGEAPDTEETVTDDVIGDDGETSVPGVEEDIETDSAEGTDNFEDSPLSELEDVVSQSEENKFISKDPALIPESVTEEESEDEEPAVSSLVSILIFSLGLLFVVPWIVIAIVQIRKRMRRIQIQKQKDFQQQQMLKITDYGKEIRRQMRGPNGELYSEYLAREARFRRVDKFAAERSYVDCREFRKSQTTCAICVEDFIDKDTVRVTACNHLFHSQCLMMWAKSKIWANVRRMGSPSCPNCNASLFDQPELPEPRHDEDLDLMGDGLLQPSPAVYNARVAYGSPQLYSSHGRVNQVVPFQTFLIDAPVSNDQMGSPLPSNMLLDPNNPQDMAAIRGLNRDEAAQLGLVSQDEEFARGRQIFSDRESAIRHAAAEQSSMMQQERMSDNEFVNRSQPLINNLGEDVGVLSDGSQRLPPGWIALHHTVTGSREGELVPSHYVVQQQRQVGPQAKFNSIKVPKSRRLEVISEDEGAMQQLGTNQKLLQKVAEHAEKNVQDQMSDASSTNAYFARKQRILQAINDQQMGHASDGYVSITEQPMFVNIDGHSRSSVEEIRSKGQPVGQHFSGTPAFVGQINRQESQLSNQNSYTLPKSVAQHHYFNQQPIFIGTGAPHGNNISSDEQSIGVIQRGFTTGKAKSLRLAAGFLNKPDGGYQSSGQQKRLILKNPSNLAQDQQVQIFSEGESVGGHVNNQVQQSHRSMNEPEIKKSTSIRSLTLQSQGARAIGLGASKYHQVTNISKHTDYPHTKGHKAPRGGHAPGIATDTEQMVDATFDFARVSLPKSTKANELDHLRNEKSAFDTIAVEAQKQINQGSVLTVSAVNQGQMNAGIGSEKSGYPIVDNVLQPGDVVSQMSEEVMDKTGPGRKTAIEMQNRNVTEAVVKFEEQSKPGSVKSKTERHLLPQKLGDEKQQ